MSSNSQSKGFPFFPVLLVGAGAYGIYKVASYTKEVDNFLNNYTFTVKTKKPKLGFTSMNLPLDVIVVNPSKFTAEFEKPSMILTYKGVEIARNNISTQKIAIQASGNTVIPDLIFPISYTNSGLVQMIRDAGHNLSLLQIPAFITQLGDNITQLMKKAEVRGLIYVTKPIATSVQIPPIAIG